MARNLMRSAHVVQVRNGKLVRPAGMAQQGSATARHQPGGGMAGGGGMGRSPVAPQPITQQLTAPLSPWQNVGPQRGPVGPSVGGAMQGYATRHPLGQSGMGTPPGGALDARDYPGGGSRGFGATNGPAPHPAQYGGMSGNDITRQGMGRAANGGALPGMGGNPAAAGAHGAARFFAPINPVLKRIPPLGQR